jgi:hypothetical protein
VIQAPKLEPWIVRYELSDFEWAAVKPFLDRRKPQDRGRYFRLGKYAGGEELELALPMQYMRTNSSRPSKPEHHGCRS